MTDEVMESHRELDGDSLALVLTTPPTKLGVGNQSANCLLCVPPTKPHSLSHPMYVQSFLISYTFYKINPQTPNCSAEMHAGSSSYRKVHETNPSSVWIPLSNDCVLIGSQCNSGAGRTSSSFVLLSHVLPFSQRCSQMDQQGYPAMEHTGEKQRRCRCAESRSTDTLRAVIYTR